jgi:DNA polymerase
VIRDQTSARIGKAALYWKADKLFMRLPSGRNLCYQSPHFLDNRFGNEGIGYYAPNAAGQMAELEPFGGKLVANLPQATARDLLAHGMMNLEAAGYPIVFHVHDETVMKSPSGTVR